MKWHIIKSTLSAALIMLASCYVASGQPAATHQTGAAYTPGALLNVTNTLSYSGQLWSLLWRPHLPAGWTVASVSGTGNPELQSGEIVWTGAMPPSPMQMVYAVQVPASASGTQSVRGEVEYQLSGMVNPATLYASPDPLAVGSEIVLRTLTVASASPGSGVSVTVSPADSNGDTSGVTEFTRQYADQTAVTLTAPPSAGGNSFQWWEQDGAGVSSNLTATVLMDTNHVLRAVYANVLVAQHVSSVTYTPGSLLGVTNTFAYSGQLWSLLWRPHLPAGWTIASVSGTGTPELQSGEIVWTGAMPASPIQMVYLVQVPANASGTQSVRGEVEYQLSGMVNPATLYASPDPLAVSSEIVLRTLTVASVNPVSGVAVTVSPADSNGDSSGVTEFTRQYADQATVTLTAPPSAGGNSFQRWEQEGVGVSSNLTATVLMDTNHVLRAVYANVFVAQHVSSVTYTPGSLLGVTNTLSYSGQLLSLLWRPQLPAGWTIASVSGTGTPELQSGEIVWTGAMPLSPIQTVYLVQVPANASGTRSVRGEVEYQLSGMVNPATLYASPDPLTVSNGIVPFFSASPTSGVAPLTVAFTNLSTGANTYIWDFGDGHTSTNVNPFNLYTSAGTFSVTLTAVGVGGTNALTRTNYIVVVCLPPVISQQPLSLMATQGQDASFTIAASGTGPLHYQWRLNGGNLSGATNSTLLLTGITAGRAGNYSVAVSNPCGSVTSSDAALTVQAPATFSFVKPGSISIPDAGPATPYPSTNLVSGFAGLGLKTTVTLSNLNHTWPDDVDILLVGPAGQSVLLMSDCGGETNLNNLTLTFDDAAASVLPDVSRILPGTYRPTDYGTGDVLPAPAPTRPYGTALSVFNGTDPNGVWRLFVRDEFTNDFGAISGGWSLRITAAVAVPSGPVIWTQPADQSVAAGRPAELSVVVGGSLPLYWQWRKDGLPVNEATNTVFTLANAQCGDAGRYDVVVTNAGGSVTSTGADLTVVAPPTITSQPVGQIATVGQTITFNVDATNDCGNSLAYQWRREGANLADATDKTCTRSNVQLADAGGYTVVVTNLAGSITSAVAVLSFVAPPVPDFTADRTNGLAPLTVAFSNLSSGATDYAWDFGDGNLSTNGHPANTYTNPGVYSVSLLASGPGGANALTRTNYIVVTPSSLVLTCATNKTVAYGQLWDFDPPTASGNCGEVIVTVLNTVTNAGCGNSFIATRTWQATDACTNSATCSQTVTSLDSTPPVLTCAPDKIMDCGAAWTFDEPTALDACCGTNLTLSILNTVTNGDACLSRTTRTWRATDCGSNSTTCSQTVFHVDDKTPPLISCPNNITYTEIAPGAENVFVAVNYVAQAKDNCDANPKIAFNPPSGSLFPLGTTTVTCTVWDCSHNTNTCSFTVTVCQCSTNCLKFDPPEWLADVGLRLRLVGSVTGSVTLQWTGEMTNPANASWVTLTQFINFTGSAQYIDAEATNFTQRFYRAVPQASAGPIFIPANSGVLTPPFVITNNSIGQQGPETGVTDGGRAEYSFAIASDGDYVIQALVNAAKASENSFFVNIDAEPQDPAMIWDILPYTSGFEERTVTWRGDGTDTASQFVPKAFTLSEGPHQLIIRGREGGVFLQSITLMPCASVRIPATSGVIDAPFIITNNSIGQQGLETGVTDGGRAAYSFAITNGGDYVIQALVSATNGAQNSFFVNIDAEPQDPYMIWDIPITPITAGFAQRTIGWRGNGTFETNQFVPKVFTNLTQGWHQLIIRGREPGTWLQSITILQLP